MYVLSSSVRILYIQRSTYPCAMTGFQARVSGSAMPRPCMLSSVRFALSGAPEFVEWGSRKRFGSALEVETFGSEHDLGHVTCMDSMYIRTLNKPSHGLPRLCPLEASLFPRLVPQQALYEACRPSICTYTRMKHSMTFWVWPSIWLDGRFIPSSCRTLFSNPGPCKHTQAIK